MSYFGILVCFLMGFCLFVLVRYGLVVMFVYILEIEVEFMMLVERL